MQNKQQFIKEKAKKMTTKTENMTTDSTLECHFEDHLVIPSLLTSS